MFSALNFGILGANLNEFAWLLRFWGSGPRTLRA